VRAPFEFPFSSFHNLRRGKAIRCSDGCGSPVGRSARRRLPALLLKPYRRPAEARIYQGGSVMNIVELKSALEDGGFRSDGYRILEAPEESTAVGLRLPQRRGLLHDPPARQPTGQATVSSRSSNRAPLLSSAATTPASSSPRATALTFRTTHRRDGVVPRRRGGASAHSRWERGPACGL
jgi:hypothetical protein